MKGLKFFINYCWKNDKKFIIYTLLFQTIASLSPLVTIVLPRYIINELTTPTQRRINIILILVFILVGYNLLASAGAEFFGRRAYLEKTRLYIRFQTDLTQNLSTANFENIESADFLNQKERAQKFLYGNGQGFATVFDNFGTILGQIIIFVGIVSILFTLNIFLVAIFVILSLINSFVDSSSKKRVLELDMKKAPIERETSYLVNLIESFQYGKEIRLFGLSGWLTAKVSEHLKAASLFYEEQTKKQSKVLYINYLTAFIRDGIAYIFLVYQVLDQRISIGDFVMYLAAVASFSMALTTLLNSLNNLRQFEGYYDALDSFMNVPQKNQRDSYFPLPKRPLTLEFHNVCFRYLGQEDSSLKNINLKILPQDKIAIVGENGAGKTTLMKLLCRLYEPTEGTISVNGISASDLNYADYNRLFSAVFQDFKLFSFSLKENIVFDNPERTGASEIENILVRNGFDKVKDLSQGIETPVYKNLSDEGFEPSGGEAQKIALARAEYKNSPFIILDEPTSSMDPKAEFLLYQRFGELVQGKTAFFVSHHLASTRFCNKILFMKKGEITEMGTHEELIKLNGDYAKLYKMQAQLYQ